jgi:hypothetical protein
VKLSKHHAFNAHENLKEALLISEKIGQMDAPPGIRANAQTSSHVQ